MLSERKRGRASHEGAAEVCRQGKKKSQRLLALTRLLISQAYIYFREENGRQALHSRKLKGKCAKFMGNPSEHGRESWQPLDTLPFTDGATDAAVSRALCESKSVTFNELLWRVLWTLPSSFHSTKKARKFF